MYFALLLKKIKKNKKIHNWMAKEYNPLIYVNNVYTI